MKEVVVILSCEHAVNTIPPEYKSLFAPHQSLLESHRGIDIGALRIANFFQQRLQCELIQAEVSRLVIDCNRSLNHPHCFSEITTTLSLDEKKKIISTYYLPFRQAVETLIETAIKQGKQVWHLSMHSFTPVLNDVVRSADIGILYNPKRSDEKNLARNWQEQLRQQDKNFKVRLNYPYRGIANGFTTELRKRFDQNYIGLELEVNQAAIIQERELLSLAELLIHTLKDCLTNIKA